MRVGEGGWLSFSNLCGNLSDTNIHTPDESSLFLSRERREDGAVMRDGWTEGTLHDQLKQSQRKDERYKTLKMQSQTKG